MQSPLHYGHMPGQTALLVLSGTALHGPNRPPPKKSLRGRQSTPRPILLCPAPVRLTLLSRLLDEVGRISEFDYVFSLKVLDRMELQPNGKLTAVFSAGVRITL